MAGAGFIWRQQGQRERRPSFRPKEGLKSRPMICEIKEEITNLLGSSLLSLELVLLSLDVSLGSEHSGSVSSGLLLVDVLHQDTLVLEDVTLRLEVKLVVHVLVDLFLLSVLGQKSSENSLTSHPEELDGHSSVGSTESLTGASVSTLSSGFGVGSCSGPRVDNGGLLDDQTILDESSHLMPGKLLAIYRTRQTHETSTYLELALEMFWFSLGSNQTLFLPHFMTAAASRF